MQSSIWATRWQHKPLNTGTQSLQFFRSLGRYTHILAHSTPPFRHKTSWNHVWPLVLLCWWLILRLQVHESGWEQSSIQRDPLPCFYTGQLYFLTSSSCKTDWMQPLLKGAAAGWAFTFYKCSHFQKSTKWCQVLLISWSIRSQVGEKVKHTEWTECQWKYLVRKIQRELRHVELTIVHYQYYNVLYYITI